MPEHAGMFYSEIMTNELLKMNYTMHMSVMCMSVQVCMCVF